MRDPVRHRRPSLLSDLPEEAIPISKITPHLWYAEKAEEAARFYVSLLPDSRIDSVTTMPAESPAGPPGSVQIVEFTLGGQQFLALNAGPLDPFNHAISFVVNCDDQAEVDRLWDALSADGSTERCGWLKDRYGVSWQVVPTGMEEMLGDPQSPGAQRAMNAMLQMKKIDLDALRRAHAGTG